MGNPGDSEVAGLEATQRYPASDHMCKLWRQ